MSGDADAEDKGFEQFEQFLEHWSRRDFLKRTGGVAAYMAFAAGGLSFLEACGGGPPPPPLAPHQRGPAFGGNTSPTPPPNPPSCSPTTPHHDIAPALRLTSRSTHHIH